MSLVNELYRETILDHYHHPRNRGTIENPTASAEGNNPLCGDECTIYMTTSGNQIDDLKIEAHGCSINMASGSMMSEAVKGQSLEQATSIVESFKDMMLQQKEVSWSEELEDLAALEGVKKYPVRIKCALLPWNTLLQVINQITQKQT
jgi:nitrogen fixation NifU-like protein